MAKGRSQIIAKKHLQIRANEPVQIIAKGRLQILAREPGQIVHKGRMQIIAQEAAVAFEDVESGPGPVRIIQVLAFKYRRDVVAALWTYKCKCRILRVWECA